MSRQGYRISKPHVDHRSKRRVPAWTVPCGNGVLLDLIQVEDEEQALAMVEFLLTQGATLNPDGGWTAEQLGELS